ncbi:hypothetical protein NP233_g6062 [Leucocoprinus birnbaumii]|uniref:Aminotransferase class I/classII large domain-containing protein n=1 Tax=Leucocoprinus birnbaumii TaxID=56174 RepID=A0AAD5VRR6_9AGAR|nr:hypothetical protein NP233_g6062 [Leucocoprinus birnbaumii]
MITSRDYLMNDGTVAPTLSDFAMQCIQQGKEALEMHKNMRNGYNQYENPEGIVNLSVAENTLMHEELVAHYESVFRLRALDFTYGDGLTGTMRLSNAICNFLNAYFEPFRPVEPSQLILGCGLMSMLGQVGGVVANRGEGILITAPYYSGFNPSFMTVYGLKVVPALMAANDIGTMNELVVLEKSIRDSNASGVVVKAVLLCNPHNPLGRCYPKDVIEGYCRLCERYNLHLLSDEIFAMSVFATRDIPHPPSFVSVLSVDLNKLGVNPARIHVLYGMSKDFNANGFRAGVLISQSNPLLIRALTITNPMSIMSSPTDALWSAVLDDIKFLENFISTNKVKLGEACDYVTRWLRFHGLPYVPPHATHFMMVDIRPIVSDIERYGPILGIEAGDTMDKRELALVNYIHENKVALSPGSSHHHLEGGWIRLSFSVRRDHLDVALRRIEAALMWKEWPGFGTPTAWSQPSDFMGSEKQGNFSLNSSRICIFKNWILNKIQKYSLAQFIPWVKDSYITAKYVGQKGQVSIK